jgi:hypothetical protein
MFSRPNLDPDPEQINSDCPELTAEWFPSARPASEVLPGLFGEADAAIREPRPAHLVRLDFEIDGQLLSEALRWTLVQNESEPVEMGLRTLAKLKRQQALRRWRGKQPNGCEQVIQGLPKLGP